ncbi:MAG: S9 family peptidase [Bernardetiaceae bacterium]|nr:S9 family peptidase [Bernardetiaceae bacterium]
MKKQGLILWLCLLIFVGLPLQAQREITVEEVYMNGNLYPSSLSGVKWMKDGAFYSAQSGNRIIKNNIATGENEVLIDGNTLMPPIQISAYELSTDEKKALLQTQRVGIYRRSFKAEYFVYDFENQTLKKLSKNGKQSYATFSPDGSKVAFVRDNNLFLITLEDMKETPLTQDGEFNHIINGSTDWVYEEELGFAKAFYFSPKGDKIAYYKFDESKVKEYNMQIWDTDPDNMLYPRDYKFKYPKAGEDNAIVEIYVCDLNSLEHKKMDTGDETDMYIPRAQWTQDNNMLAIRRLNRNQNHLELLHADASTGKIQVVLEEKNDKGYTDIGYADELFYLKDGKSFIIASEESGYKHLYHYDIKGKLINQITKGNWEVSELLDFDPKTEMLYYVSTEVSPLERHFYRIQINGKKKEKLTKMNGMNSIDLSKNFAYYLLYHSNTETPPTVRLFDTPQNKELKLISENENLLKMEELYGFVRKEFFEFKNRDGVSLNGYVLKPKKIDKNQKLPLLIHVYGGPSSQMVKNDWDASPNFYWHQMLVQKGYVVVCVDNRGTDARGRDFKQATYKQLGKLEIADQIDAAKHFAAKDYIDENRIGIWGWSYGGYMTALGLTVGADVFKMGIAVAPVTTWRLYDTIYTERFLMRPQDNPEGYDENSPLTHADKLKGSFLMIHGTGDDNVHIQNAILLQDALIKANKHFQAFYYPNRDHGIYGGITRVHLFNMMSDFIFEKL